MMKRSFAYWAGALPAVIAATWAMGQSSGQASVGASVYEKATASMVPVQYVWDREIGRQEITAVGVAIGDGTIIMLPMFAVPTALPDSQIKDFKVIVPKLETDHVEIEATLVGRDERYQVAFIKLKDDSKKLPAITFTDKKWKVGEPVYSVGMLQKSSGYKTYLSYGLVGASLRGETPVLQITGELGGAGSLVFDANGDLGGFVQPHDGAFFWLEPRSQRQPADSPRYFVSASEILPALASLPKSDGDLKPLPFTGIAAMNGLSKDLAEVFDLEGRAAVEIGDVIPASAAARAGLQKGWIITEFNGKSLERGDEPEELGGILARQIARKNVGDKVSFTVITKRGDTPKTIEVTLEERPPQANTQPRFYAEELGFTVRDGVLGDYYRRKMLDDQGKPTTPGVLVAFIKPNSSAQTGRLQPEDLITQMNGSAVTSTEQFKTMYEAFRKDKPKDPLILQVSREGATQVIKIEPPQ